MLTALMSGPALTAGELAREAGVTAQTASSHLSKLEKGGLIVVRKQGRHSYFALADADVGGVLEGLMGLAVRAGHQRTRHGPKEPALRNARVCYDHLAGDMGVAMLDGLVAQGRITDADTPVLTADGEVFVAKLGIDLASLRQSRRPLCKSCLDWSVRRSHLAGALGGAMLTRFYELGWAKRVKDSRTVTFSPTGQTAFAKTFGLER